MNNTKSNFVTILQVNGGTFKLYNPFQVAGFIVGEVGGKTLEIKLDNIKQVIDNR